MDPSTPSPTPALPPESAPGDLRRAGLSDRRFSVARPPQGWISAGLSLAWVVLAVWATGLNLHVSPAVAETVPAGVPTPTQMAVMGAVPTPPPLDVSAVDDAPAVSRQIVFHTIVPNRPRVDVIQYTVQKGDSVFGIADKFGLKPETILWGNYAELNDDPHLLRPGQVLNILPVNGTYYRWQAGDNLEVIAKFFGVAAQDILDWPGNHLEFDAPSIQPESWLVVPGGVREFKRWVAPTIPKGKAGVGSSVGPGACPGGYQGGAVGGGGFVWPSSRRSLSGNDYWAGHLAIDIGAVTGDPIYAADSGVVVFAGPAYGGYGNMIMIDHGNGWQTLYAHLSAWYVACGQSVYRGSTVGAAGSTGNSTGPHLHFETRLQGGFVNPHLVLPPP